jgi:hypothetical protein
MHAFVQAITLSGFGRVQSRAPANVAWASDTPSCSMTPACSIPCWSGKQQYDMATIRPGETDVAFRRRAARLPEMGSFCVLTEFAPTLDSAFPWLIRAGSA